MDNESTSLTTFLVTGNPGDSGNSGNLVCCLVQRTFIKFQPTNFTMDNESTSLTTFFGTGNSGYLVCCPAQNTYIHCKKFYQFHSGLQINLTDYICHYW